MQKVVTVERVQTPNEPSSVWHDYYEMTKPKVVLMLLLTALVGMCLAVEGPIQGAQNLQHLIAGLIGIGMLSSAAAVINHVVDRKIDSQMARTQNRPVTKGRVSPQRALVFAAVLGVVGYLILELLVNRLTAVLTVAGLVGYAFIYTMYLKRATPQNIVIGGLAGAIPPLLGWTAMTGEVHPNALLLVLIVFTWTPPHFWALAIHRVDDYAKANIPMLPVTHGVEFTKTSILLYTVLLFVVCLLPYLVGMAGIIYLSVTSALNAIFLYYALKLKYAPTEQTAINTFAFSIVHLMILYVVLLLDHYILITP